MTGHRNGAHGANGHANPKKRGYDLNDALRDPTRGPAAVRFALDNCTPFAEAGPQVDDSQPDAFADFHDRVEPEAESLPVLMPFAVSSLHGVEPQPREWIAPNIPRGVVTILGGPGGSGKSLLAAQLAFARAIGATWLGHEIPRGVTLYLSCEDDTAELHRRFDKIAMHCAVPLSDARDLHMLDMVGEDAVLGALNRQTGMMVPTPLYQSLTNAITILRPDLLILDSLPDVFAGNENDRQNARHFIASLTRLCREHSLTIIVIAHPSLTGMSSGTGASGSTAWTNSVRSRLYFEAEPAKDGREPDPDVRVLSTKKSNYGPLGDETRVRYVNGVFVPIDTARPTDRLSREAEANRVFLDLLAQFNRTGQEVSDKPGRSYAPALFAAFHDCTLSKIVLRDAMSRLLHDGRIRIEKYGPPSKQRSRLIVPEGRE
jgi:RecA-family ATPase